jgi:hypothetical protein
MAFSVGSLDELILEYLLWRGFVGTYRSLQADIRSDKDRGFQVGLGVVLLVPCSDC